MRNDIKKFKFISFSIDALKHVKKVDPRVYCGYIATWVRTRFEPLVNKKHIRLCINNHIEEINGHWLGFSPQMIKRAQESKLVVGLGFIDGRITLNYCNKHNVKRLYTNKIKKLSEIITKYR